MGRRAIPSTTLAADVRKHFGLTQAKLGDLLRLTRGQVAHVEAGRHLFAPATELPLLTLAAQVYAPDAPPAPTPAALLASPAPAPFAARLDYCQHHAAKLRRELKTLEKQLKHARRWQAALLTQADERARPWLLRRQEQAAADLDAGTTTCCACAPQPWRPKPPGWPRCWGNDKITR